MHFSFKEFVGADPPLACVVGTALDCPHSHSAHRNPSNMSAARKM